MTAKSFCIKIYGESLNRDGAYEIGLRKTVRAESREDAFKKLDGILGSVYDIATLFVIEEVGYVMEDSI